MTTSNFQFPISSSSSRSAGLLHLTSIIALLILFALPARAGRVALRIWAANPTNTVRTVQIKSNLPARVREEHILEKDGLNVGYDVKDDVYYVHKTIELGPKKVVEYRVELEDIWVIPEDDLDAFLKHTDQLVDKLKGTDHFESVQETKDRIAASIARILEHQRKNAVKSNINALGHIKAYDENILTLGAMKKDVGDLENLVLGAGKDPGQLLGEIRGAMKPSRDIEMDAEDYKEVIIRLTVRNPSVTQTQKIPIKRRLPPEVKVNDVLDPDGLDVLTDPATGGCYVYKKEVIIPPEETVTFKIRIRDKWDVNGPRIEILAEDADKLLTAVASRKKYPTIEQKLSGLMEQLTGIKEEEKPTKLNAEYVAFFRNQAKRLDSIELQINRISSILKPMDKSTKLGFKAKPPSTKSTWMIIYIILGFLALMSLLFFLRWFGKTKSEQMG